MNHCIPGWNFEGDQVTNHKKSIGPDHELVELLWQNGQVVLNSQTHRIRKLNDQPRQATQDDDTVSWIHNPFEECLDKEFCSSVFNDLPSFDSFHDDGKEPAKQFEEHKLVKFTTPNPNPNPNPKPNHVVAPLQQPNPMPPPRFQLLGSTPKSNSLVGFGSIANSGRVTLAGKVDIGAMTQGRIGEGSTMTVGSSHCGSNQVQNDHDFSRASTSGIGTTGISARPLKNNLHKTITQETTTETTLTTSSGFSTEDKRKRSDMEESEGAELESAAGNKSLSRQSRSSKRSRAAEVHNLSERRRRDRINEKMKALQELIPHCSKTDKASMLDEAIEYLKSLQLQLQVMWMGGGMGPMMFPSVQHYMSRMSMGMGLPRVPLINQSVSVAQTSNQALMCQNQALNHVNYSNQMQNPSLTEQYARYLSFHQMQNSTQPMNMNMLRFGSQQSHSVAPPVSSIGPYGRGTTTNDALSGKSS